MSQPSLAHFQREGSASPCTLHGHDLKWKNCSVLSGGMGGDKSTLGKIVLSGCQLRDETGDYLGGTTIPQVAAALAAHGIKTEQHVGGNVCTLWYASYQGASGRGFLLQGNTQPDGRGNVNHAVWVNHPIGGTPGDPDGFWVMDPWSTGPAFWSYAKTKAFALALHPYGEADPRTLKSLGINGIYALIFPDTEPHAHLHYGGAKTAPFPDALKTHPPVAGRRVNVRSRPDRLAAGDVVGTLPTGTPWTAFQVTTTGAKPAGSSSRTWYGNHDGNRWIHSSGVVGVGGAS